MKQSKKKLPTANFSFRLFPFPLFIFSFSWFFLPAESFLNSIFLWSSFSLPHSPFCLVLALCIPFLFPGPCVLCVCVRLSLAYPMVHTLRAHSKRQHPDCVIQRPNTLSVLFAGYTLPFLFLNFLFFFSFSFSSSLHFLHRNWAQLLSQQYNRPSPVHIHDYIRHILV